MSNLDIGKMKAYEISYTSEIKAAYENKVPVGYTLSFCHGDSDFSCEEGHGSTVFEHKDGKLMFYTDNIKKSRHLRQLLELSAELTYNVYFVSRFKLKVEGLGA